VQHKVYHSELDQEAFMCRLHGLTYVENDRPMSRFVLLPSRAKGVDSAKPLYGSVGISSFKLWENSKFWSGEAFTYIHGVWSLEGSGLRLIMRPRLSPILRMLALLPLVAVIGFYWDVRDDFSSMTLHGQVILLVVGLMIGLCFWLPFGLVHRVQSRDLIRFLEIELTLKKGTA
jgi:hypothetical protein